MTMVIDASVAISWVSDDENDPLAEYARSLVVNNGGTVPQLWFLELANILALRERKGRITSSQVSETIADLGSLKLVVDGEAGVHAFGSILTLAQRHRLSSDDATYLELAIRKSLPLATLDRALAAAAKLEGVPEVHPPA